MRLLVLLSLSVLKATLAIDIAEDQFFHNSSSAGIFLPANNFDDNGQIMKVTNLRRYHLSNTTFLFRVLWNPVRCALPDPKRGVILSFFKEWSPLYQPTMRDMLQNAFVFSSPLGIKKPTDMPWERKFKVSLTAYLEGTIISEDKHLKMDMYSCGFFAKIRPPKVKVDGTVIPGMATLQFFDSKTGEAFHQATIPLLKEFSYMSLFSRSQPNCTVFFSKVNKHFTEVNRHIISREKKTVVREKAGHSQTTGDKTAVEDFYKHFAIIFIVLCLWLLAEVLRVRASKTVRVDNAKVIIISKKNISQIGSSSDPSNRRIPTDHFPFYVQMKEVPYKTGRKVRRTWYYYMPSEWKIESSQRKIMNNDELAPEVKKISLMINTFFLKNEHAYVGRNGVRNGYLKFFKEYREKIEADDILIYAIVVARHLLSVDIFTLQDYAQVFDDMGNTIIKSNSL